MVRKTQQLSVEPSRTGQRLDRLLSETYPWVARATWQERIRAGTVLLNARNVRPSRSVQTGDLIEFQFDVGPEPEVRRDYQIVHRDTGFLVIDKPPNLPVHPSGVYNQNTLLNLLRNDYGPQFHAGFVNRLDRETSGLMIVATNAGSARAFQTLLKAGQIEKEYQVLVFGQFPDYMDATGFIGKKDGAIVRKKQEFRSRAFVDSKSCRTEFFRESLHDDLSLVRARLHTGRMHQIRATLCSLGFPVVGDRLYGPDENMYLRFIHDEETEADRNCLRMQRTALHSKRLHFLHPVNGKAIIEITSPLPNDIRALTESGGTAGIRS